MNRILEQAKVLYPLKDCTFTEVSGHEGGRNTIVIVSRGGEKQYVLRICALPKDNDCYGLVHFDYSDGNHHIDMATGAITVFDFDNCMNCWYMFDLANLWTHNEGWTRQEPDPGKRLALMHQCFDCQL